MRKSVYIAVIMAMMMFYGCDRRNGPDACGSFESTEIIVSSQGAGQLMSFGIMEGETVEAGAVVGLVDTVQLYLQKLQIEKQLQSILSTRPDIESQVASLQEQISTQKSERARAERLVLKGAAPQKQLDDLDAQIKVLESQLSAQLKSLSKNSSAIDYNAESLAVQTAIMDDRIERCRIKSPANGTVIAKYANAGEMVGIGTPLMKVADLSTMYLRAYFTSDQLSDINIGDTVRVTADYGGDRQYEYKGTVSWISSESEFTPKAIQTRNTRANLVYAVKIAVKNDGRLKLGMYGEASLE